MKWIMKHPRATGDMLGLIPSFLSDKDPRHAKEQINDNYAHGGGWSPFQGFKLEGDVFQYPEDPPLRLIAETELRGEVIRLYEHSWLVIIQPDGSWETSRVD